jgi:hypothetical protein
MLVLSMATGSHFVPEKTLPGWMNMTRGGLDVEK